VELKGRGISNMVLLLSFYRSYIFNGGMMKAVVRMVKREYHGPIYEVRIEDKVEETFCNRSSADFYAEALNKRGVN
jgi:hypothetical protein